MDSDDLDQIWSHSIVDKGLLPFVCSFFFNILAQSQTKDVAFPNRKNQPHKTRHKAFVSVENLQTPSATSAISPAMRLIPGRRDPTPTWKWGMSQTKSEFPVNALGFLRVEL